MINYFRVSILLVLVLSAISSVTQAQEENVISNEGEITIYAKSKNVWKVLTNTKKYAKVMGYKWESGKKDVDSVGDQAVMEFLEQQTAYEVTMIEPSKQISVKIVPLTAGYVNEKTWIVIPEGKWTTKVRLKDVYTIPEGAVPPTVKQQINTLQKRLEKLKSMAERSY